MTQETEVKEEVQERSLVEMEIPANDENPKLEDVQPSDGEGKPVKRKPGRPKKVKEEKTTEQLVQTIEEEEIQRPGVKHIFRTISEKNVFTDTGAMPASALESYIQTYLLSGWEILNTHFLGKVIEGYTILYILVKYAK